MPDDPADDLLTLGEGLAPELAAPELPESIASLLPKGQDADAAKELDLADPELVALVKEHDVLVAGLPPLPSGPRSPKWDQIENALLDPRCNDSIGEIARENGIQENTAYRVSTFRKWMERRRLIQEIARKTNALAVGQGALGSALVPLTMQSEADQELRMLDMVDRAMRVWDKCLEQGKVQFKSAKDLDTLVRLVAFIQGRAERIIEQRHRLSPKEFEKIVSRVQKRHRWSPEQAGLVRDAEFEVQDATAASPDPTPPSVDPSVAPATPPDSSDVPPAAHPPGPTRPHPTQPGTTPADSGDAACREPDTADGSAPPGTSLARELVRAGTLKLRPRRAPAPTPPTPAIPATAAPTE